MLTKLKELLFRSDRKRREFVVAANNFAQGHKDALIIMADPHTELIVVMQGGAYHAMRFTEPGTGKPMHIVSKAVHYQNSKTDKAIDQFLLAVDSGLFKLAEKRYNIRKRKPLSGLLHHVGIGKRPEFEKDGGVVAPYQLLGKNSAADDAKEAGTATHTDTKDTGPAAAPAE